MIRTHRFAVEELERRENPAVIAGTPLNDVITLENLTGAMVRVTVESFADPAYTTRIASTTDTVDGTDGLFILAGLGDDTVKVVGNVPLNANTQVDGGAGNDRVVAFAGLGQPVTFAGGAGTDTVDLFAVIQTDRGFPEGDVLFATDAAVARQRNNAVFFTGTESTVVHGTVYPDILVASTGLPAPVTFVQGGGQVIDTVYLYGTAGDDVFFASDAAVDRAGDAAVFLPADLTSMANVSVLGNEGTDLFFLAADLAVQPRPNTFAGEYRFDGGPGFDAVYLNGTPGSDRFGLSGFGPFVSARRDPTVASVYAFNTEVVSLYGFAGDDTLTADLPYFTSTSATTNVGFAAGDGTDTVQVQDVFAAGDPAVIAARYQFGPTFVIGPNGRVLFYDGVEATRVVGFPLPE